MVEKRSNIRDVKTTDNRNLFRCYKLTRFSNFNRSNNCLTRTPFRTVFFVNKTRFIVVRTRIKQYINRIPSIPYTIYIYVPTFHPGTAVECFLPLAPAIFFARVIEFILRTRGIIGQFFLRHSIIFDWKIEYYYYYLHAVLLCNNLPRDPISGVHTEYPIHVINLSFRSNNTFWKYGIFVPAYSIYLYFYYCAAFTVCIRRNNIILCLYYVFGRFTTAIYYCVECRYLRRENGRHLFGKTRTGKTKYKK